MAGQAVSHGNVPWLARVERKAGALVPTKLSFADARPSVPSFNVGVVLGISMYYCAWLGDEPSAG